MKNSLFLHFFYNSLTSVLRVIYNERKIHTKMDLQLSLTSHQYILISFNKKEIKMALHFYLYSFNKAGNVTHGTRRKAKTVNLIISCVFYRIQGVCVAWIGGSNLKVICRL